MTFAWAARFFTNSVFCAIPLMLQDIIARESRGSGGGGAESSLLEESSVRSHADWKCAVASVTMGGDGSAGVGSTLLIIGYACGGSIFVGQGGGGGGRGGGGRREGTEGRERREER